MERRNGKKILYASIVIFSVLTACVDEELISGSDNDFLKIEVYDENIYGTEDELSRAEYSGLHTDFEEGDAIGVYAVNGTSIVSSNVKFVLTDGVWIPLTKVSYNPDYTYYAYFPYTESPYSPSFSSSSLDEKFANFISDSSNKFWNADQSTKNNFTASNLMISQGVDTSNKTIKFQMQHKRALAVLTNLDYTWCYDTDPDTEYPVNIEFVGNIPYYCNGQYYYLMIPGRSTYVWGNDIQGTSGKYTQVIGEEITKNLIIYKSISDDNGETWSKESSVSNFDNLILWEKDKPIKKFLVNTTNFNNYGRTIDKEYTEFRNNDKLKTKEFVPSITDLSMVKNDGTPRTNGMTTANCYLVHAPGNYKLPLVYGNAIKHGATNTSSYHSDLTGSNILSDFLNHNNVAITDPWLKNNGVTVDGVELLWQDVQGLISSVGIEGDYLTFTVSKDNIAEGNAVIAAKQGDTIVWSWHIWVTPETLNDLVEIDTGVTTYKVSPVNVGQVTYSTKITEYKNILIKYSLRNSTYSWDPKTLNITFIAEIPKKKVEVVTCVYNPYYQWGRKDPEIPGSGISSERHIAYDIEGNSVQMEEAPINTRILYYFIQNPLKRYKSSSSLYMSTWSNLWDINGVKKTLNEAIKESHKTIKTIYDPCPPDMTLPTYNLTYYLWFNGTVENYYKQGKGAMLYTYIECNGSKQNLSWALTGSASTSNKIISDYIANPESPYSYYWSSVSENASEAFMSYVDTERIHYIINGDQKSSSYPVRPVAEED